MNMNKAFNPELPSKLEAMWDDRRDGTLSAEQQAEFDALLAQHDDARTLWQAESQWLEALADTELPSNGRDSGYESAFTADVLATWQSSDTEYDSATSASPVIGRIEPVSPWRWAASVAAAVALIACGMFLANQMNQPIDDPNNLAKSGTNDAPLVTPTPTPTSSPVSMLVSNTSATDLEAAHPSNIRRKVSEAVAVLDPGNLVDLLGPTMPDPADYFEPL